ncbi:MAG TPA: hypothetical protein VF519_18170 [Mycobacteriales bacterium]
MNVRRLTTLLAALATASATAVATAPPSYADTISGSCDVLFADTLTRPGATTLYVAGHAAVVTTSHVTSVELGCRITTTSGTTLGSIERGGNPVVFAGAITVTAPGPYLICTMVNVHYENGDESNPSEHYTCQPVQSVGPSDVYEAAPKTGIGGCDLLASGPSTSPSSTPFHVAGYATSTDPRVTALEIRCELRTANGGYAGSVRGSGTPVAVAAGSIPVSSFGPFLLCTLINVRYADDGETYSSEYYACQPAQSLVG